MRNKLIQSGLVYAETAIISTCYRRQPTFDAVGILRTTSIDASILVAYYWPERLSRAAQSAIQRAQSPTISTLSEVEFISTLALKRRAGEITEISARRMLAIFRQHRAEHLYQLVPIEARELVLIGIGESTCAGDETVKDC